MSTYRFKFGDEVNDEISGIHNEFGQVLSVGAVTN